MTEQMNKKIVHREKGKEIVDKFEPRYTKESYLKLLRSMYKQETFEGHSA